MKKPITYLVLSLFLFSIAGCNENEVQQISKDGAIETAMNVDHLDESHDIIITTHKVWVKNVLIKTIIYKDTIPTLGLTSQEAENSEGETKTVSLKKDYEVYITVK
jgi:hypothetical protein